MSTTAAVEPQFKTVDGVRLRYGEAAGPPERTVLLTSPWPESLYAFAPIWGALAKHARLFAVDLPGFGASERREDLLSPRAMGEFLAKLIEEAELGTPHVLGGGRRNVGGALPSRRAPGGSLERDRGYRGAPPSRSSWVSPWPRGCSTPTSTSTARWTRARFIGAAIDTLLALALGGRVTDPVDAEAEAAAGASV